MNDLSATFRLTMRQESDRVVVIAHGELDLATVPHLEERVQELRSSGVRSIVLDLRELSFIDSTGVRLLLQLDGESRADGFDFSIIDVEGPVRRVLVLTGIGDRLQQAQP